MIQKIQSRVIRAPEPNREEHESFLRSALTWHGSVSPKVFKRVLAIMLFAALISLELPHIAHLRIEMTPFEFAGFALGLLLVFRTNAGYDRWWEARKLWGSIVNQSRNLASSGAGYCRGGQEWRSRFLRLIAAYPHVIRKSLRGERDVSDLTPLLGKEKTEQLGSVRHLPSWINAELISMLASARQSNLLEGFEFQRIDRERAMLVDAVGACERILKTPMPLVFAIKARRFILIFLLLLPFALVDRVGLATPFVTGLVAYALFSLDQIGVELQNPFSVKNLSHLPLDDICCTIENNVLDLEEDKDMTIALAVSANGER
jgi:putative membrane protein